MAKGSVKDSIYFYFYFSWWRLYKYMPETAGADKWINACSDGL